MDNLYSNNAMLRLAYEFTQYTGRNIFLTGKAGTGKTTFLRHLRETMSKRMVVVAPTGVAAINAGGVTIHSFFQLPFGTQIPEPVRKEKGIIIKQKYKFNKNKILLIKSLDILIIDEISMVRADMLDAIDEVLRRYKISDKPFGGVQLLMIGDLYQLPPIVKDNEWALLQDYYENPFFFSSKALQKTNPVRIELKHIYRQSDSHFINILGEIRDNAIKQQTLDDLNKRYIPDFKYDENDGYIVLTTHNESAKNINNANLNKIDSKLHKFNAKVSGEFPVYNYPTHENLHLKEGAQVMFVKNDSSRDKRYYNGKIGRVIDIDEDIIYVSCNEDDSIIAVEPDTWNNIKYELNEESKEVTEKIIGSFVQYPLKLAWAITIHKSQGLTFEKAIIDAQAAFAFGQVYVALSRCRSLSGIVLKSPIKKTAVISDKTVNDYTNDIDENIPDAQQLLENKRAYQLQLIQEVFDFGPIMKYLYTFRKIVNSAVSSFDENLPEAVMGMIKYAKEQMVDVAVKFDKQLKGKITKDAIPEEDSYLQERYKKACNYFHDKTDFLQKNLLTALNYDTDNKQLYKDVENILKNLKKELFIKNQIFAEGHNGFHLEKYLRIQADADISYEQQVAAPTKDKKYADFAHLPQPELYKALMKWREDTAYENMLPVSKVLPRKALARLLAVLPATPEELSGVKGIGQTIVKRFGEEILDIINAYCLEKQIDRSVLEFDVKENLKNKPSKGQSQRHSLRLFKEGLSVEKIAQERNLAVSTIEGHLIQFIAKNELSIFDFMKEAKVNEIAEVLEGHQIGSLTQAKSVLGDDASYSEIRAVMYHLKSKML